MTRRQFNPWGLVFYAGVILSLGIWYVALLAVRMH